MKPLYCWKCHSLLTNVILPMSRREECANCGADQHVCKMCTYFDSKKGCDEERAEEVSDLEKANFCDYFKPSFVIFERPVEDKSQAAKAKLAALFSDPVPVTDQTDQPLTPKELAEKKLRELLGG
ncbi:hypothetical protein [Flavobacterium sp. W21_SRS_FM6]|uniref:hypothetical protein n=1 Tax=Flavobacterium sp. W21_SRS_FM6 TaxID=3240268 RepID=UPI003F8DF928